MAVLNEIHERENDRRKHEALLAALPTSAIYNVHRKKGKPPLKPSDFVKEPRKPEDYMSVEEAKRYMDAWARARNEAVEA